MTQSTNTQQNDQKRREAPPPIDDNAPIASLDRVRKSLDVWGKEIERMSPKMALDRFNSVVLACFSRTPKLMECTRYSIRQAILAAGEMELEVGGVSGEAYLVPYNTKKKLPNGVELWVVEAQFIAGYKGYLRLAQESGLFRKIEGEVILPDDTWTDVERGPDGLKWGHVSREPKARHMMTIQRGVWQNREKVVEDYDVPALRGAYAYARPKETRDDDYVTVIWKERLEEIRTRSKAGFDGPWITDYHEMARKTAVRALWKKLPKSDRMRRLEEHDQELEVPALKVDDIASAIPTEGSTKTREERSAAKTQSVADKVAAKNAKAAEPPPAPPSSKPPASAPPSPPSEPRGDDGPDYGDDPDRGP